MPADPASRFAAVLFDLDGTLIDSMDAVRRSWRRWADEEGVPVPDLDRWAGVPAARLVEALLPPSRVAEGIRRLERIEVADTDGVVLLPGAARALAELPPDRIALVTSCSGPLLAARLRSVRLVSPAVVVTADDVERGKPDPEPFALAARRLGVPVQRCLAVEDAVAGLASARDAGCRTLGLATTHPAESLPADLVVPDLAAVRFSSGPDGVRLVRQGRALPG